MYPLLALLGLTVAVAHGAQFMPPIGDPSQNECTTATAKWENENGDRGYPVSVCRGSLATPRLTVEEKLSQ